MFVRAAAPRARPLLEKSAMRTMVRLGAVRGWECGGAGTGTTLRAAPVALDTHHLRRCG